MAFDKEDKVGAHQALNKPLNKLAKHSASLCLLEAEKVHRDKAIPCCLFTPKNVRGGRVTAQHFSVSRVYLVDKCVFWVMGKRSSFLHSVVLLYQASSNEPRPVILKNAPKLRNLSVTLAKEEEDGVP